MSSGQLDEATRSRRRRLWIGLIVSVAFSVVLTQSGTLSGLHPSSANLKAAASPDEANGGDLQSPSTKQAIIPESTLAATKTSSGLRQSVRAAPVGCGFTEDELASASLCAAAAAAEGSAVTPRLATDSLGFSVTRCLEVARFWSGVGACRLGACAPGPSSDAATQNTGISKESRGHAAGADQGLFALLRAGELETDSVRAAVRAYESATGGCGTVVSGGVLFSAQGGLRTASPPLASPVHGDAAAIRAGLPPTQQQLPTCPIDANAPKRRELRQQKVSDLPKWDGAACAASTSTQQHRQRTPFSVNLCGGASVAFASELYRPHHALHFLWSYIGILAAQVAAGGKLLPDRTAAKGRPNPDLASAAALPLPDAAFLSVMPYGTINTYTDFNAVTSPHLELLDLLAPRVYIYRDAAYARYVLRPPSWWLNDTAAVNAAIAATTTAEKDPPSSAADAPVCAGHVVYGVVPARIPGIRKKYHTGVGPDVWAELRYRVARRWKLPMVPPTASTPDSPLGLLDVPSSKPAPSFTSSRVSVRVTRDAWGDLFLRPILVVRRDARFGRHLLNDRAVARLVQLELTQLLLARAVAEAAEAAAGANNASLVEVPLAPGIALAKGAGAGADSDAAVHAPLRSLDSAGGGDGLSTSSLTDSDAWPVVPGLIPVRFVRWEGRSIREQMAVSLHARAMIGVHGNGLAWTCLMPGPVPITPPHHVVPATAPMTWVFEFSSDIRQRNEVTPGVNTTNAANIVAPSCGLYSLSLWCPYEETQRSRAGSPHRRWKNVDVRAEEQQLLKVQRFIRSGGAAAV